MLENGRRIVLPAQNIVSFARAKHSLVINLTESESISNAIWKIDMDNNQCNSSVKDGLMDGNLVLRRKFCTYYSDTYNTVSASGPGKKATRQWSSVVICKHSTLYTYRSEIASFPSRLHFP